VGGLIVGMSLCTKKAAVTAAQLLSASLPGCICAPALSVAAAALVSWFVVPAGNDLNDIRCLLAQLQKPWHGPDLWSCPLLFVHTQCCGPSELC
jgi:hypothetical protein